mgnify:CR=1 FL=1
MFPPPPPPPLLPFHPFHVGGNSSLEPNFILRVHASYRIFVVPLVPLVPCLALFLFLHACYCALSLLLAEPFRDHNRIPLIHLLHSPKPIPLYSESLIHLDSIPPSTISHPTHSDLPPTVLLWYVLVSIGSMAPR